MNELLPTDPESLTTAATRKAHELTLAPSFSSPKPLSAKILINAFVIGVISRRSSHYRP
jgi:hypothetical protein